MITLSKDITITDEELKEAQNKSGVFVIPEGVTLKGDGKTISAGDANIWRNSKNQFHILSVEGTAGRSSSDPTTTIIDLTVVGNENTKSGINAYCCVGTVELQNVTIQNCGNAAVQVNGSRVTAEALNTSGNKWGAVNVDKGFGVTSDTSFTLTSGDLQERVKIWTELKDPNDVIIVPDDWTPVTGGNNTAFGPVEDVQAAFPAVADKKGQTVYYQSLDLAVQHAGNGDTIVLPAGTFELTGNIEIEKAVNLRGAGADQTVIEGSVMYNVLSTASNSESITVEELKIQATKDDSHQALCWSRQNRLSGYTLNVKNCAFDGWQYGIGVNSLASGCTLNVSDTVFENTFCAISIKETLSDEGTNTVGTLNNVETAAGAYAVQSFSTGTTPFNGYYSSVENYLEDKRMENWMTPIGPPIRMKLSRLIGKRECRMEAAVIPMARSRI